MSHVLRRLPLSRLLVACGLVIAVGVSVTAIAFALDTGPTPAPRSLADAVHDALAAAPVEGVSASVQLTDRLLEGANLASGSGSTAGELASSPLLSGASGRLWIAKDGRLRLELQSEKGDTQILYDGHTLSMYDASSNTLYRYALPAGQPGTSAGGSGSDGTGSDGSGESGESGESAATGHHETPTVAKIEEGISHLSEHANVSSATPTDIAGQPAYTVRVSPKEAGSMIGGAELSWDAVHGVPLRAAIYSSSSSSPVLELAATEVSYGPVESSVFEFTPPANAKIVQVKSPAKTASPPPTSSEGHGHPKITAHGQGITAVAVLESEAHGGAGQSSPTLPEGLQKVKIDGVTATELPTELGTLLSFERSGVRYLLAGAVSPAAVEAVAKGL